MKFAIGVDCEGPACVVGDPGKALSDSGDFAFARAQATREADAAARALFEAGAKTVLVWDNHGLGSNLEFDRLDRRCDVALGTDFGRRWPGLDETFTAVLMIGYHAMAGTAGGVLAHTYSSEAYRWIKVNGQEVGEIALDAAVAGEMGVPLIFVASDEHGCDEARRFTPWVHTVATKQGLGRHVAFSKHPARVVDEIYQEVGRAVSRLQQMRPFTFDSPVEMELCYRSLLQAWKGRLRRPGWRFAGPRRLRRRLENMNQWRCTQGRGPA